MIGKKATARIVTLALCGALAVSGIAVLVVPAVALGECSCSIEVHGSNCPLSRCTCDGAITGAHAEGCPLAEVNADLTVCVCEPTTHAEGCPRYLGEGALLAGTDSAGNNAAADDSTSPDAETSGDATVDQDGDATGGSSGEGGAADDVTEEPVEDDAVDDGDESDGAASGDAADGSDDDAASDDAATGDSASSDSSSSDTIDSSDSASSVDGSSQDGEAEDDEPVMEPLETEVPDDLDAVEKDWEYPSGWSGYGEGQMEGNLLAAVASFTLEEELEAHVEEIRGVLTNADNVRLVDDGGGFGDVLAVYAVLTDQTDRYPYGVSLDEDEDVELLSSVYWSMTQVTGVSNASGAAVSVRRLTAEEGADLYEMDEADAQAVLDLAEQNDVVENIVDESIFASLDEEELDEVLSLVPDDIAADRRSVLLAAVSLVGKVDYFWGGKSLAYGWDDRWGEMRVVSSTGHSSYGTALPLGLDCSGFVSWAFVNAYGTDGTIGDGATNQLYHCDAVSWEDAEPGDLVFYYDPSTGSANHVGIVVTADDSGPETVVHCTTGGVKLSDASGFSYVGRPAVYSS